MNDHSQTHWYNNNKTFEEILLSHTLDRSSLIIVIQLILLIVIQADMFLLVALIDYDVKEWHHRIVSQNTTSQYNAEKMENIVTCKNIVL